MPALLDPEAVCLAYFPPENILAYMIVQDNLVIDVIYNDIVILIVWPVFTRHESSP